MIPRQIDPLAIMTSKNAKMVFRVDFNANRNFTTVGWLVFNGAFSINRLYRAIEV